jgi:hypothetical protein
MVGDVGSRDGGDELPAPFGSRRPTWRAIVVIAPLALAACGDGGIAGTLRSSGVTSTPDEFLVLPTRPLEMPENFTALPSPTPGAVNRVDIQPHVEAIAGLTGAPGPAGNADGTVLVAEAGPRQPGVRQALAIEDVEWRNTHHGLLIPRLIAKDKDTVTYQPMILDSAAEFLRLRAAGIEQPPAPPEAID